MPINENLVRGGLPLHCYTPEEAATMNILLTQFDVEHCPAETYQNIRVAVFYINLNDHDQMPIWNKAISLRIKDKNDLKNQFDGEVRERWAWVGKEWPRADRPGNSL